jgi:hypothetical protein
MGTSRGKMLVAVTLRGGLWVSSFILKSFIITGFNAWAQATLPSI